MPLIISNNGQLSGEPTWQEQYEDLRKEIMAFCKEEALGRYPEIVIQHFDSVWMDFETDQEPTETSAGVVTWGDKIDIIEMYLENTDSLIVFGDKTSFPVAIQKLSELRVMLAKIFNLIPDSERNPDDDDDDNGEGAE